jgi:hypothetical protein
MSIMWWRRATEGEPDNSTKKKGSIHYHTIGAHTSMTTTLTTTEHDRGTQQGERGTQQRQGRTPTATGEPNSERGTRRRQGRTQQRQENPTTKGETKRDRGEPNSDTGTQQRKGTQQRQGTTQQRQGNLTSGPNQMKNTNTPRGKQHKHQIYTGLNQNQRWNKQNSLLRFKSESAMEQTKLPTLNSPIIRKNARFDRRREGNEGRMPVHRLLPPNSEAHMQSIMHTSTPRLLVP